MSDSVNLAGRQWLVPLIALALLLGACTDSPTEPDPEPRITVQLQPQGPVDVEVGEEVPVLVEVRSDGAPLEGAVVRWTVAAGEGSVAPANTTTDGAGRAEAVWSVGSLAGAGALEVRVEGADDRVVDATIRPGAAETLVPLPDTVHLRAQRARARPPVVFHDRYGNETVAPSDLAWEVADPMVASVDDDGMVTAGEVGTTTLNVTSSAGDGISTVAVVHEGVITITFDDGFRSVYERAYAILEGLGLKANVAIVTQAVEESWPDFLDLDQLSELHDAGWAVGSHSVTHARLDTLSTEELHRELADSRSWIEAQGFRGSGVFVVPYHEWDERVREAVAEHYAIARGRGLWKEVPETESEWIPEDRTDLSGLDVDWYGLDSEEELEWLRTALERAVEEGRYFELYFHRVEEADVETFTRIVEVVAEFREHVRTYDQLLHQVKGTGP